MSDPVISSFAPSLGPVGTQVTVSGSGFTSVTALRVGGVVVEPIIISDTEMTFVVTGAMPVGSDDVVLSFAGSLGAGSYTVKAAQSSGRNPLLRPFAVGAYPNVSVGSGATTVPAGLLARSGHIAVKPQEIPMNMDPSQVLTEIFKNAGQNGDRCASIGPFTPPISIPFPSGLVITSSSDNYPSSFVGSDGTSRYEGGNFGHCSGLPPCSGHFGKQGTLVDDAIGGASGGSGLSTTAGTIRSGELANGTYGDTVTFLGATFGAIRHTLRIDLMTADLSSKNGTGWTWPASTADGGATDPSNKNYYSNPNIANVEGALFVLPQSLDLESLQLTTVAAKQFAWTLLNYGARPCNTQGNSTWAIATEWSLTGRVAAADGVSACEFMSLYGYPMATSPDTPFGKDMNAIITNFGVVTNEGSNGATIGGPGTRLQPAAPALAA